ncbi:MAG: GNAT family N-acetyltransferase [Candidatus Saccharicenans sp.]|nr:GNAT family N-acetyltransferase [Candidatus Saccharicenans sp.]
MSRPKLPGNNSADLLAGLLADLSSTPHKVSPQKAEEILQAAQALIKSDYLDQLDPAVARSYLTLTSRSSFLSQLGYPERCRDWAETCFSLIQRFSYGLLDLFEDRVKENPEHVLFIDLSEGRSDRWTYAEIASYLKLLAGSFYLMSGSEEPRVAIFSENHLDTACCDLACLFYDILVAPLNSNFSLDNLELIFNRLRFNLVVTDSPERLRLLAALRQKTGLNFEILSTRRFEISGIRAELLGERVRSINPAQVDGLLGSRRRRPLDEVCTVMFTSGSTGQPKGVSFSGYNLISKRFARAAALPEVGDDEVLLAFLPLYHTFGRYFELLGSIFWRGTYVFSGNPSVDTLLSLFPKINPTGLVSVPIRWLQIYERCLEEAGKTSQARERQEAVRSVIGTRLRWGISAAGYLDPRVFHFFEGQGVKLVSGFGLTEATGGLTMTPPGQYLDNTQGLPLPGVDLRLSAEGELLARGHYIARYLEEIGPGDRIPYPQSPETDYWLRTGDVFRLLPNGYYQIVDRIKDIYKNNRGQTIAPRKVEDKFKGVPGIKNTFLVGDGRPFNILLIVPDNNCPELREALGREGQTEYYKRIIEAANLDLAPYERIINFALLDRDFSREKGELTAKGSFNRKNIVANHSELIESLYRKNYLEIETDDFRLKIPFWLIRDLGLLEGDFKFEDGRLIDRSRSLSLEVAASLKKGSYRLGDLVYEIPDGLIDLGIFARQPYLWCGNQSLADFLPVKEGWDTVHPGVSLRVKLPGDSDIQKPVHPASPKGVTDPSLLRLHQLITELYFGSDEEALEAMAELERLFYESENLRISTVLRLRLEALADHPKEKLRCWAYRLLILDRLRPDYHPALGAFIESGKTFLNEESIEQIASSVLESGRFEALRRRLAGYRNSLHWPASGGTVAQFKHLFKLLGDFAQVHPEFTSRVAAELASWALHRQDPVLAAEAERVLRNLYLVRRLSLKVKLADDFQTRLQEAMKLSSEFSENEKVRIIRVLADPTFLLESIRLGYDDYRTTPETIVSGQIRVSRISSIYPGLHLRVCVNTRSGEHFDLRVELVDSRWDSRHQEKVYWHLLLSEHYDYPGLLPRLASWRPDLRAISCRFLSWLSVGDRLRDFATRYYHLQPAVTPLEWRMLYIRAISLIYQAVGASDFRLVAGEALPENITVDSARPTFITLGNLRRYEGRRSLVKSILDNFYLKVAAAYPWTEKMIDPSWAFDACFEVWEEKRAFEFLDHLLDELRAEDLEIEGFGSLRLQLESYLAEVRKNPVLPISVVLAIRRYKEWEMVSYESRPSEKEKKVLELAEEISLDNRPEWIRFYFYRHTYFSSFPADVARAFERLLARMKERPDKLPVQFLELSELQACLEDKTDLEVFSRMVFPRSQQLKDLSLLKTGDLGREKIVIQSTIADQQGRSFTFRQSYDPSEIGQLYRLFLRENYPRVISQENQSLVLVDEDGFLVGGISFRNLSSQVVFLEGVVVAEGYKNRGLGRAMLRDFIGRMASLGVKMVMTHYLIPLFFMKEGFALDRRWGALVRSI